MKDGASCSQVAINDYDRDLDTCDSSFKNVATKNEGKSYRCGISFKAKEIDYGAWKCMLEKCQNKRDGGCSSNIPSQCKKEIIVNATVWINCCILERSALEH